MALKRGMINNNISTSSKTRSWCYDIKKRMVLNPLRSIMFSILAGFFVSINFMVSIVIIYEKVIY